MSTQQKRLGGKRNIHERVIHRFCFGLDSNRFRLLSDDVIAQFERNPGKSPMKRTFVWIGLCFVVSHSLTALAQEGKVVSIIEIPRDAIDQSCEIVLKSTKSASTEIDAGKIVRFDDVSVVLVNATRTVSAERSVPILGSIPYLSRLFRTTSIGVVKVPGELAIGRNEIKSIKFEK